MIIGLGGELESGKNTVADVLNDIYGFTELSFAKNLKEMCIEVFKVPGTDVYTTKGKRRLFKNPRVLTPHACKSILRWVEFVNKWPIQEIHIERMNKLANTMTFTTPREMLQQVGTEVCRHVFDPVFHAKVLFNQIDREPPTDVAISDARFFNERSMVSDHHGKNILVKCVQQQEGTGSHQSENEMGTDEDYDAVLYNDKEKSMAYLRSSVQLVMRELYHEFR